LTEEHSGREARAGAKTAGWKRWARYLGFAAAAVFLVLTGVNASWLAPVPRGGVKLIAHRGVHQLYDQTGLDNETCTAERIEQPMHAYLENTVSSMLQAQRLTAQMVEIDVAPTADGRIAVFHDWTVDCRTEGHGQTRDFTMAQLKALDAGYGYTADGGKSFPFRGKGVGAIPALEEALAVLPRTPILFNFKSKDPAEADLLAKLLKASGRDVERIGDGFYGDPAPVARIAQHFPKAWAWSKQSARACSEDYVRLGWSGYLPASCRGGTMIIPLDRQWPFWGWPNRLIARMEAAGGRVLVVGPQASDAAPMGLSLPEQLGEVPSSFNGYLWIEDIWNLGPSLHPLQDRRGDAQVAAAEAGLARRRARMAE
jgi:glycerophosphoryl diester phosphodiesterase